MYLSNKLLKPGLLKWCIVTESFEMLTCNHTCLCCTLLSWWEPRIQYTDPSKVIYASFFLSSIYSMLRKPSDWFLLKGLGVALEMGNGIIYSKLASKAFIIALTYILCLRIQVKYFVRNAQWLYLDLFMNVRDSNSEGGEKNSIKISHFKHDFASY